MSTKKEDEKSADDASPKIESKPSSPTLSENSVTFSTEKSTTVNDSLAKKPFDKLKKEKVAIVDRNKSQTSNEKSRSNKANEISKSQSNKQGQAAGRNQQSSISEVVPVERKVSRYSERRNKIKEKQSKLENMDTAVEEGQINDPDPALDVQSSEISKSEM